MGWLIEALANVFLETLGDMMSWTVLLISDFRFEGAPKSGAAPTPMALNIGLEDGASLGDIVNPTTYHPSLFESVFGDAASFSTLFWVLGISIAFFLIITKLIIAMGGPFTRSQDPGTILVRGIFSVVGVVYSYTIFAMFEILFNGIYGMFMKNFTTITKGAKDYALSLDGIEKLPGATDNAPASFTQVGGNTPEDAFKMFGQDLIKSGSIQGGHGIALTIIAIVLFSILLICYAKLVLEIYERYVIIGVMFYTSPLAFATLVEKNSTVFSSWVQMVFSEFIVMCSNLFFTGVFISAWTNILKGHPEGYLFSSPADFITKMLLMIAWLIIGQEFDQHLKGLGLSTAQTGRGLGGAVMAGLGAAYVAGTMAKGALGAGYSAATGQTKLQRSLSQGAGPAGSFYNGMRNVPKIGKNEADNFFSKVGSPGSGLSNKLKNMDSFDRGQLLMNNAKASMGEESFNSAIKSHTGQGSGGIDPSTVKYENGTLTGKTWDGNNSFAMHNEKSGESPYVSNKVMGDWSVPMTHDEAVIHARNWAKENSNDFIRYEVADLGDPSKMMRISENGSREIEIPEELSNLAGKLFNNKNN